MDNIYMFDQSKMLLFKTTLLTLQLFRYHSVYFPFKIQK